MKSLHAHLRETTRAEHMRLHDIVNLNHMLRSLENYRETLVAYFRAVAPAESGLLRFDRRELANIGGSSWDERFCKSQWLERDIRDLSSGTVVVCDGVESIPPMNLSEFIGTSYMLEGMTLGNRHISRQIDEHLENSLREINQQTCVDSSATEEPIDLSVFGKRFFRGHGEESGDNWKAYCHWLEGVSPHVSFAAVGAAAKRAFQEFGQRFSAVRTAGSAD